MLNPPVPPLSPVIVVLVAIYMLAQGLVLFYALHRMLLLWRWSRRRPAQPSPYSGADFLPYVTVQLPVYNEPRVIERLIASVAALEYPRDRLEIQVLDDSTDSTTATAEAAAARFRTLGVDIRVLHRDRRRGCKAGALADGLLRARGELIAVFDADFVPPPDFLARMVPHFREPDVGMVQARWTHLNRHESYLTEAQAVLLDAHFVLEHAVRQQCGHFFNFNGTAGLWRRRAIEDAGGWSDETLTEDLDLSYRAQLAGWRFVFDPHSTAPAELPADLHALQGQQRRWTKGAIQCARKLLPRVLREQRNRRLRLEAVHHLTANLVYPLILVLGILMVPLMVLMPAASQVPLALHVGVVVLGFGPTLAFLFLAQRRLGRNRRESLLGTGAALLLGIGLSINNSRAVWEGLRGPVGVWERTPKRGQGRPAARSWGRFAWAEAMLGLGFALASGVAAGGGHHRVLPFLLLMCAGFTSVVWSSRPVRDC
jgi:cellulose synthase/poly-beta-1,6-N-acetylglucosamine synthase-like glycosyltransferase